MNDTQFIISAYGTNAILIRWKEAPSIDLFSHLNAVKTLLENKFNTVVVLAYQELLLKNTRPTKEHLDEVLLCLRKNKTEVISQKPSRLVRIPVCYDVEFGEDLKVLAKAENISIEQLIRLHTQVEYFVYFIGFLPGFPYLSGLDTQLHTPRKSVPSRQLVEGSVAIGGEQTGIYPQNSPGGWHVIGHCPIPLFDARLSESSLFLSGDKVRFEAITKEEHRELSKMSLTRFRESSYLSYA